MLLSTRYEWELSGDCDMSVYLDLDFDVTVHGLGIDNLKLLDLEVVGVTFAMGKSEQICDGERRSQPELPDAVKLWFMLRFKAEYNDSETLQQEFRDLLEQKALAAHYEALAA